MHACIPTYILKKCVAKRKVEESSCKKELTNILTNK